MAYTLASDTLVYPTRARQEPSPTASGWTPQSSRSSSPVCVVITPPIRANDLPEALATRLAEHGRSRSARELLEFHDHVRPLTVSPLPADRDDLLSSTNRLHLQLNAEVVEVWPRHPKWGRHNTLRLLIEGTLYEISQKLIEHATHFPYDLNTARNCTDDPWVLEDVSMLEMDALLSVLDVSSVGDDRASLDASQWAAVLHLSTKWGLSAARDRAISMFDALFNEQDTFDTLDLAFRCKVGKWVQPAYRRLCERPESLSLQEAAKLGLARFVAISRIRDEMSRMQVEMLVDSVNEDNARFLEEPISLLGRCSRCKVKIEVSGKPRRGVKLCAAEDVRCAVNVSDLIATAEVLKVLF